MVWHHVATGHEACHQNPLTVTHVCRPDQQRGARAPRNPGRPGCCFCAPAERVQVFYLDGFVDRLMMVKDILPALYNLKASSSLACAGMACPLHRLTPVRPQIKDLLWVSRRHVGQRPEALPALG